MNRIDDPSRTIPPRPAHAAFQPRAIHARGGWTADRAALALVAALLPSTVVAALAAPDASLLGVIAVAMAVIYAWQVAFAQARGTLVGFDGVATALALGLLLPATAPLWQVALAATTGIVLGELVFGGRGRSFVSPAAVGAAFFMFSFPAGTAVHLELWSTLVGAAALIMLGLASWRVLAAGYAGLAFAAWIGGSIDWATVLFEPFAFGIVFLAGDPVVAAATNPGRLAYGVLIGVLTIVFGGDTAAVVFAVLLGAVFAPAIDTLAIFLMRRWRGRRPWLD